MSAPIPAQTRFDVLLSEASLGLSYLDTAAMLEQPDRKASAFQNAKKALDTVNSRRAEQALTSAQAHELDDVLHRLQTGLADVYQPKLSQ